MTSYICLLNSIGQDEGLQQKNSTKVYYNFFIISHYKISFRPLNTLDRSSQ